MTLLSLPVELLQRIIKETIPESIENVAVTCSSLHNASNIFLEQYNRLRKRYRHFEFSRYTRPIRLSTRLAGFWDPVTVETGIEITSATELVQQIACNPLISRYIEKADLKGNIGFANYPDEIEHGDPGRQERTAFPRMKDESVIDRVRLLLNESPYLVEAAVDPEIWLLGMLEDTAGHAEVLLLTLLPRVRELALPAAWNDLPGRRSSEHLRYGEETPRSDRTIIWPVLDAIVRRANDPSIPSASLSTLETLLPFKGTGYECRNEMTKNTPMLAIKSLREAYIGGCIALDDGYTGMAFDPGYEQYSPLLEKLELVGCTVGPAEMGQLLSRMPNVKRFHFAYETKWHGCGYNVDAGHMLNTIMECAGESLEELSMWLMTHYGTAGRTLTDMKGFERLKSLHVDGFMLMGSEFRKDDEEFDVHSASDVCPVDKMAAPRAVDLLPPSLERFHVQIGTMKDRYRSGVEQMRKCLRGLFDGFAEERGLRLPHLTEVIVEVFEGEMDPDLTETLGTKGVTVILGPSDAEPHYLADFHERFGVDRE